MGWTAAADGGAMMRSAQLWPHVMGEKGAKRAWVVDLRPGEGLPPDSEKAKRALAKKGRAR